MYRKLFSHAYIGGCRIKNRVVMPAMTTIFGGQDNLPSEEMMLFYEERAKGGCGLIITECFGVEPEHGVLVPCELRANPMGTITYERMLARVHKYGAKMFAQLNHGGINLSPEFNNGCIVGPSEVPGLSGIVPRPLTADEIEKIRNGFISTAFLCKLAGFDGVEVHAAHGYLLSSFLSGYFNRRDDQYGGSLENRARFLLEIVGGIKAACGSDFPVIVRLNASEYDESHENTFKLPEAVEVAKMLEAAGADAINVSCSNYFSNETACEPYSYEQGWRKNDAATIKKAVCIPVIGTNTIKDPEFAEQLLLEGVSDFVAVGRAQIADPEWCSKARENRSAEIRRCLSCCYCLESEGIVAHARCSVNPRVGKALAFREPPMKNGAGRRIAVIGGGPAGMEASIILGQRGFDVTLFDKGPELGGSMNLADKTMPYKDKLTKLTKVLTAEVERAGVHVRLNTEADVETVKAIEPAAVFLAAGAEPFIPQIPGIDREKVVLVNDYITGAREASGRVILVGGGLTGLEAAEMLTHSGKVSSLTIADMLPEIGMGVFNVMMRDIEHHLDEPLKLPGHMLSAITDRGAMFIKTDDQSRVEIDADYVVLALGLRKRDKLLKEFEANFSQVITLGENRRAPGRIAEAISDGFEAAYCFEP